MTLEVLKSELVELGNRIEDKQNEIVDMFEASELPAYFRCRDTVWTLASALHDLEKALYKHKITI
jgi:hypothetical protein